MDRVSCHVTAKCNLRCKKCAVFIPRLYEMGNVPEYNIDDIKKITVPIAQKYGVKKLALFGSYARGEQTINSDIDFLIDKGKIQGWEIFGFINNLEDDLGIPVDVITYDALNDTLINEAAKDEVVLYEDMELLRDLT